MHNHNHYFINKHETATKKHLPLHPFHPQTRINTHISGPYILKTYYSLHKSASKSAKKNF
jgi:hypothetical protein